MIAISKCALESCIQTVIPISLLKVRISLRHISQYDDSIAEYHVRISRNWILWSRTQEIQNRLHRTNYHIQQAMLQHNVFAQVLSPQVSEYFKGGRISRLEADPLFTCHNSFLHMNQLVSELRGSVPGGQSLCGLRL
uniref:AlNc14C27G2637 protein n=1 Tax=Albugo laibachii Nc14 TaxID=890382 RepID=F0W705_9STRA|nr:AlNc14C27G2637 [Albugo laibachii Nc14]|eukprot:CCA16900.1 AlNc14C27G2637 [Albugo laibachii Nc14]